MTNPGPFYPNQQLQSVSLETFFRGRASVLSRFEQIQQEFDAQLPNLFVPNAIPGQALSLQPYQLRSKAGGHGESLAVAVNQATYMSFDYPGYSEFTAEALRLLLRTYEILDVTNLERVVYRYENLIAVERREDLTLTLNEIIEPLVPERHFSGGLTKLQSAWASKWERGIVEVGASVENADGVDALRLTIAAFVIPAGPVSEISEFAENAHGQARECFESLITDEFRHILKGSEEEEMQ